MEEKTTSVAAKVTDRISVLVILSLLIFLIFARTGESMHGQLTKLGANLWENYFELRDDLPVPSCDVNLNVESRLTELEAAAANSVDEFDLFDEGFDRGAARISLVAQQQLCVNEHAKLALYQEQVTSGLLAFSVVEHQFAKASIYATAQQQLFLVILLFCAAGVATQKRHHISFRPIVSKLDFRLSTTLQFMANGSLAISAIAFRDVTFSSAIAVQNPEIINALTIGAVYLAVLSLVQLFNIPKDAPDNGGLIRAMLSVPLYTIVMLIFASIVFLQQNHIPGLAIYFNAFFENSGTYLDVALYLWSGMLLKQTQLGERVFNVFTPWKLPPELLAFVAIFIMAVPTAYTGASSIIILAMGAVVYRELRKVGTRRQLALAATAMSGSSGIVLRPCLIVVIISILNKEVVTDDLFHWGIRVFMLTAFVFFVYAMITRKGPLKLAPIEEALKPSLLNMKALLPYVAAFLSVIIFYAVFLDAYMDQFSAPIMLPIIILAVIVFERKISKAEPIYHDPERSDKIFGALTKSMGDAAIHIGGLLMMMSTFVIMMALGGKAISATFLTEFGSLWATMGALVAMFVLIGMFMESMAAVGLVSLAIAPIAYAQGIDPIHFWMTCLVALELGYLSPPVALSHIFTRQVVGEEECIAAAEEGDTFYYRHERLLLPLLVMGTTLVIVAFGPLALGYDF